MRLVKVAGSLTDMSGLSKSKACRSKTLQVGQQEEDTVDPLHEASLSQHI